MLNTAKASQYGTQEPSESVLLNPTLPSLLLLDTYAPALLKYLWFPKHVVPFYAPFFCPLELPLSEKLFISSANFALSFVLQN